MCGFQTQVQQTETQTIKYNQLFYSSTNTEDGGLDIATGVFTAPTSGTYTVTWSLTANAYQGFPWIDVFLLHNGEKIVHHYHTEFGADDLGMIFRQKGTYLELIFTGGRTIHLHLEPGDSLELYCDNCKAGLYEVFFCVNLA